MTRVLAAAALVACAVATAGCTKVNAPTAAGRHPWTHPGSLRLGSTDEPDGLDPLFAHSDATDQIDALIFAPIFRYGPRGEMVPELVTEVPTYANGGISRDSKTIVLHWRRGVRWSDGAPLTPRDLRFTWRVVMDDRLPVKLRDGWDDIATIDVPNDATAIVRLKRPDADVLGSFGGGGGSAYPPLPEHLLGHDAGLVHSSFETAPISSGPFLLTRWNHGSSLDFTANAMYWRGAPKLHDLTYRIVPNPDTLVAQLLTHDVDLIASVGDAQLPRVRGVAGIHVDETLSANIRRLEFDVARPGLRDVRVRRALAEAIDWDRLEATVYGGIDRRARSDIVPTSWAAPNVPTYPHDPAAARVLLDAAGYRPGPGGIRTDGTTPLRFTISATNRPGNEKAEVVMQQAARAVGIGLTIKNYPPSLLFSREGPIYTGSYDMEWSIDTYGPDPDNQGLWSAEFIPPRGSNTSFLRDPLVTRTSAEALLTFDRAKRKALYQTEETRLHELVPMVPLYWQTAIAAYNDDLRHYEPAEYITNNWNAWEWSI